jgi:hypothetical protein
MSIEYGLIAAPPPGWYSKWRWFVDPAFPVLPTYPITVFAPTLPEAELYPDRCA